MATACAIGLQTNVNNIVYAGQELCGTVRLTLVEEKHLRGIYIQIDGKGFCQWDEGRTTLNGRADFLKEIIYLVRGQNGRCVFVSYNKLTNFLTIMTLYDQTK